MSSIRLLFSIMILLSSCGTAYPDPLHNVERKLDSQKGELDSLTKKILEGQRRLKELDVNQVDVNQRIEEMKRAYAKAAKRSKETQSMKETAKRDIQTLKDSYSSSLRKYQEFKSSFYSRLKSFHRNQSQPFLKVLFGSKSLGELDQRLHYYKRIVESESGHFQRLKQQKSRVQTQLNQLQKKEKELESLSTQLVQEKNSLLNKIQSDKNYLLKLAQEQEMLQERARKMATSSKYLKDKIQNLMSARSQIEEDKRKGKGNQSAQASFSKVEFKAGKLEWPLREPYKIAKSFGNQKEGSASIYNPGIDLVTDSNRAVYASADGEVFYKGRPAGNSSTYGKVVMITHPDEKYITLYGNLDTILVALKQPVKKGDKIATIGSSDHMGIPAKPRLHYQVRVYGEPKNPVKWLARRK